MLNVLKAEVRFLGIARGGPDELGGAVAVAEKGFQFPDLSEEDTEEKASQSTERHMLTI